jgi:hypothetical protein
MTGNVSIIIREIHRVVTPGNPHWVASAQLVDGEDGWVSPVFPIDFHDKEELERKISQEIILYLTAKANLGKRFARGGLP